MTVSERIAARPILIGEFARLTLVYRGSLPACQPNDQKSDAKQRIRLKFSGQLEQHWLTTPVLKEPYELDLVATGHLKHRQITPEAPYEMYPQCCVSEFGYRIFPLVCRYNGLIAEIEMQVLRRSDPGGILNGIADIDNQLKVIFDALRMPLAENELPGNMRGSGSLNDRLFCLLEDDSLITRLLVDTDRLHTPQDDPDEPKDYAEVNIKVVVRPLKPFAGTERY